MLTLTAHAVGYVLALGVSACGSKGGLPTSAAVPPTSGPVAEVRVSPTRLQLPPDGTDSLSVSASTADGVPVPASAVSWSTTEPKVATVDAGGRVTARNVGHAWIRASADGAADSAEVTVTSTPSSPVATSSGIWISQAEVRVLPTSGQAWSNVKSEADSDCGTPDLADQNQNNNVCIMAKALVFVRTGVVSYRNGVVSALRQIANSGPYEGRALALGRELAAYVISADLINLRTVDPALDDAFRSKLDELRTTYTDGGGVTNLIECDEVRPNNWGNHCGASRVAVALYLGDRTDLERAATVFRGFVGDRSAYNELSTPGFRYGELSWQCDRNRPVGINPPGCTKGGHSIDGVVPDDQRRCGSFQWPPCLTNYAWETLQGAVAEARMLSRAGYDAWGWENRALLRAVRWLYTEAQYPARGDDTWIPWLVNAAYGTNFPVTTPAQPGKNVGWTDWTH